MKTTLSQVIVGAAAKRLTAVEVRPDQSNQHELNGIQALRGIFGEERRTFPARFVYLGSEEADLIATEGFVTWYDARERHATRSEFRLYFPSTDASDRLNVGDLALILRQPNDRVLIAFAQEGSTAEHQLFWLFRMASPDREIVVKNLAQEDVEIGFAAREVLNELGIELELAPVEEESCFSVLLDRFGSGFPPTAEFSEFAREVTPEVEPAVDPDHALLAWLEREEALFRRLEAHLVLERLRAGFAEDVDGFISFSLSVQNRRKARVGLALENHLEAIFHANNISYSRGQVTERTSRPDFIFPSIDAYRAGPAAHSVLHMLAAKSTCKDRWRQILTEADKIPVKHLLTLEPGISVSQTDEMRDHQVRLVIPASLHETFNASQRGSLLSLAQFIALLETSPLLNV